MLTVEKALNEFRRRKHRRVGGHSEVCRGREDKYKDDDTSVFKSLIILNKANNIRRQKTRRIEERS